VRMAAFRVRGRRDLTEGFAHEGILGTLFAGRLVEEMEVRGVAVAVPTIAGQPWTTRQAWITGIEEYLLVDDEPFPTGYTVGDLWGPW